MPNEPPPSTFEFPAVITSDERGIVAVGGNLEPGTLLAAYRAGLFPMRQPDGLLAWWFPDPRGVLFPESLRVTKSLRRSLRRYTTTVDTAFVAVTEGCADRRPDEYLWITDEVRDAYLELHRLGWAHSVETWWTPAAGEEPRLVGGLYGVAVGGLFAGESMFSRAVDASKVALVALVDVLRAAGSGTTRIIDTQWLTPHLAGLGAVAISRDEYLERLRDALAIAAPSSFAM